VQCAVRALPRATSTAPTGFTSVNGINTPLLLATSIVVVLPCILIFFLAQRHMVGGISFTGST
jgi:multiple sugar transport system permease protein